MTEPLQPLAGVRVVDFGQLTAGANLSAMLADLGADVIKVESGGYMDLFRYTRQKPGTDWWNQSPQYHFTNRNKRSIAIDLKLAEGRALALELLCRSDIVVENYRRGVLDRVGLGPETVCKANPRIVFASVSSQGETGPNRMHRTYGSTLDAMGGIAALTGYAGGAPTITGGELNYPDQVVSLMATGLVIAALREARRTGRGGHLDIAQREVVSFLIGEEICAASLDPDREAPLRNGNQCGTSVLQDCFLAADERWLAVSVEHPEQFAALDAVIEGVSGPDRDRHKGLGRWIAARPCDEGGVHLRDAGIAAWPVLDGRDLLAADDLLGCSLVKGENGMLYKGMPYELQDAPFTVRRPAPDLGQDTEDILREIIGMNDAQIAALAASGVTRNCPENA